MRYCWAILALIAVCGCGGSDSSNSAAPSNAAASDAPQHAPAGDPATLPKVPADEAKIAQMIRERFGDALTHTVRVEVENKPEGLRVGLFGEVPNDEIRVALMNEVEARVQNIKIEDFNLDIAGPVRMLFSFPAWVRDGHTYFAPDLSFALAASGSVYETATGRRINRIDLKDDNRRRYMDLSPDGKTLAVSHQGGEIDLLDMPLGRNARVLQSPLPPTSFDDAVALAFSPDNKQLITISRDHGDLRVWDLASGRVKQIGSHLQPNSSRSLGDQYYIAMSPDGKLIATANFDLRDGFYLWNVASRSRVELPKMDSLCPTAMAWSHDGKTIAVGRATDEKRGVMLYDVAAKQFKILAADQDDILTDIAFSPDDKTLAVAYEQQGVRLWDPASGTVWQTLEHEKKSGGTTGLAFSQDGAVLATDGLDLRPTQIRLWDVSRRPGATPAVALLPKAHPEIVTQDDRLAAEIEHAIRGNFDPRNVESLKVEILADGSIKLTGKVSDREVKKVAEREAMDYHDSEDIGEHEPNKVVDEIEVTGKLFEAPPTRTRRTD